LAQVAPSFRFTGCVLACSHASLCVRVEAKAVDCSECASWAAAVVWPMSSSRSSDPCTADIVRMLTHYAAGLDEFLNPSGRGGLGVSRSELFESELENRKMRDDEVRIQEAQREYTKAVAFERRRWLAVEAEMSKARASGRRDELDAVKAYIQDTGLTTIEAALQDRCSAHVGALEPCEARMDGVKTAALSAPARARQDWTNEECKVVVLEMRKEWRGGQRRVLQQMAHDFRAERNLATEALERQVKMSQKAADAVRLSWLSEIQQAHDDLSHVSDAYGNALRTILEAKLMEARQHAKEQAEFYRREIHDTVATEDLEAALHQSQRRKMRLAMLKWRHDYLQDARRKAEDYSTHRFLAGIVGHFASEEDPRADNKLAAGAGAIALSEIGFTKQLSTKGGDYLLTKQGTEVTSGDEALELVADKETEDCRKVLKLLWERFPVGDEEARDFLMSLEELMPYTEEVLRLYENHLGEHGVLAALECTADVPFSQELLGNADNKPSRRGRGAATVR